MALGRTEQIDKDQDRYFSTEKALRRFSHRKIKKWKHRRERRRAKTYPECHPEYNKYAGWEW
jgi:hypothetical protein